MKTPKFDISKQKIFFSSDFHFSHRQPFIWSERGFASIKEHADFIIEEINKHIGANDILFYLGDFSLNSTPEETKEFFRAIKCQNIYYVWGNHESNTQSIYKEALAKKGHIGYEIYPFKWENVTFFGYELTVNIEGQIIVLSHFARLIWDMMQHGAWNLCGHSHSNCPQLLPENIQGKILDVGVDVGLKRTARPFLSFEEVYGIMKDKTIVVVDHHNKSTT